MGRRYQAILESLGEHFDCFDKEDPISSIVASAAHADAAIVATPTDTHGEILRAIIPVSGKILCEKPISKDPGEVSALYDLAATHDCKLTMMMQYSLLHQRADNEISYYDYFRTGPDGMPWDAFQIIALAEGPVFLGATSPIWHCVINGKKLCPSQMDRAYVNFVTSWLRHPASIDQRPKEIIRMHEKVASYGQ